MTATKRPMPPIPNPLPPDFSLVRFWCEWQGIDYAKEQAANEARMNGRPTLGTVLTTNGHACRDLQLSASASKRQARMLKNQSLPIPCPFCASLTREQQIDVLMELLFDAVVDVAKGVMEGGAE